MIVCPRPHCAELNDEGAVQCAFCHARLFALPAPKTRRLTQNERILRLLATGPKSTHEILCEVPCIVHSRVAELRGRGYEIDCWRDGDNYFYRLASSPERESHSASGSRSVGDGEHSAPASTQAIEPAVSGDASGVGDEPAAGADQLSLLVEAA